MLKKLRLNTSKDSTTLASVVRLSFMQLILVRSLRLEMFKQQRKSPFSPPRLGWMLCVLVFGLLLALPVAAFECKNCIHSTPSAQPLDWNEWKRTSGLKPAFITEDEMVRGMVAGSLAPQRQPDYATATIARWETPIRVRLLDGNDDDLPLDESPGKEIAYYLRNIGRELGLTITITTREKQDNNVSIVLGRMPKPNSGTALTSVKNVYSSRWLPKPVSYIDPETTTIGSITGVPELDIENRKFLFAYKISPDVSKQYQDDNWEASGGSFSGSSLVWGFVTRYVRQPDGIKACIIFQNFAWDRDGVTREKYENTLNFVVRDFNRCLGVMNTKLRIFATDKKRRGQIESSIGSKSLFHLKVLYDPVIKSGMSTTDAELVFAKTLSSAQ